jgi:hypothetical protein
MLGKIFDLSLRKLQDKHCDLPKEEMTCSSILRKAKEKIVMPQLKMHPIGL